VRRTAAEGETHEYAHTRLIIAAFEEACLGSVEELVVPEKRRDVDLDGVRDVVRLHVVDAPARGDAVLLVDAARNEEEGVGRNGELEARVGRVGEVVCDLGVGLSDVRPCLAVVHRHIRRDRPFLNISTRQSTRFWIFDQDCNSPHRRA
jgi:hypothetical protein